MWTDQTFIVLPANIHLQGRIQDFSQEGAPLRNDVTDGEVKKKFKEESFISGGGAHPLHPPPRSAPDLSYESIEIVSFSQLLYNVYVNPNQQVARVKFCLSYKVLFTPVLSYMFSISFLQINKIVRTRNTPPPTKSRSQNLSGNAAQILKNDDTKHTSEVTVNQFITES